MRAAFLPHRRRGFTLLEVTVAIAVALLILGVAALSLRGVDREAKLRRAASQLETSARSAMREALVSQRPRTIFFANDGFGVVNREGKTTWKRLGKDGSLRLMRWGEAKLRQPANPEVWRFEPGLPCEPLTVRLTLPEGTFQMSFDPLTAAAVDEALFVNR